MKSCLLLPFERRPTILETTGNKSGFAEWNGRSSVYLLSANRWHCWWTSPANVFNHLASGAALVDQVPDDLQEVAVGTVKR